MSKQQVEKTGKSEEKINLPCLLPDLFKTSRKQEEIFKKKILWSNARLGSLIVGYVYLSYCIIAFAGIGILFLNTVQRSAAFERELNDRPDLVINNTQTKKFYEYFGFPAKIYEVRTDDMSILLCLTYLFIVGFTIVNTAQMTGAIDLIKSTKHSCKGEDALGRALSHQNIQLAILLLEIMLGMVFIYMNVSWASRNQTHYFTENCMIIAIIIIRCVFLTVVEYFVRELIFDVFGDKAVLRGVVIKWVDREGAVERKSSAKTVKKWDV